MKLSMWAKKQGIHYQTAWRWFKAGILPIRSIQLPTGTILVYENEKPEEYVEKLNTETNNGDKIKETKNK